MQIHAEQVKLHCAALQEPEISTTKRDYKAPPQEAFEQAAVLSAGFPLVIISRGVVFVHS